MEYDRYDKLAWVETALRYENRDLEDLRLGAQSHYGPQEGFAFIEVYGVDDDQERRRSLREDAANWLRKIGCDVDLVPGRDVYNVTPETPRSFHEELQMLFALREAVRRANAEPADIVE